jgi:hypothetical protein
MEVIAAEKTLGFNFGFFSKKIDLAQEALADLFSVLCVGFCALRASFAPFVTQILSKFRLSELRKCFGAKNTKKHNGHKIFVALKKTFVKTH